MQYVWSRQRNLLRSRQRSGLSTEQCFSWLKSSPDVNTLTRYTATEYRCIQNIAVSNNTINCAKPGILRLTCSFTNMDIRKQLFVSSLCTFPKLPHVMVTLLVTVERCNQGVMLTGRQGRRGSTPGLLEG